MPFDDRGKLGRREWLVYADCLFLKVDRCLFSPRQVYLGLFDSFEQRENIVVVDQYPDIIDLGVIARKVIIVIHRTAQLTFLQHKCPFPILQFAVEDGRHFYLLVVRLVFHAPSQVRSHFIPHDLRVEQVTADIDTAMCDDIVFPVFLPDFIG